MQGEQDFNTIVQHLQRSINCLSDEDRNIRRTGLTTIKKQMESISKENILRLFNQTKLTAYLTKTYSDKIEANRQLAFEITKLTIIKLGENGKNLYEVLLCSLIPRINETPFPQNSEDLRLMIVGIFIQLIPYKECFLKNLPDLANAISKCLLDAYDLLKINSCELINKLSLSLRHQIGKHSTNIVKSLGVNLTHQKFKVRKSCLQSIGKILVTEGAGANFQIIKVPLKSVLSDKKKEVREASLQCAANLLLYMSPKYMKQYEATLTGFLLMGLDDESPETRQKSMELLQKCGAKLREEEGQDTAMINQSSQQ